ncbi:MAG: hypothetical protein H0W27_04305 [Actinobacteria bacterium]|nr:hypothetical protein [Actinomycetota bacterium]
MDALERAGVDATQISMRGRAIRDAGNQADTTRRDIAVTRFVGSRAFAGAAAGAVVGGILGFALGAFAFEIGADAFWAAIVGGVLAGGAVGGMLGGVSSAGISPGWELTHERSGGGALVVGVHSAAADLVERAGDVLEERNPLAVGRFDAKGRSIEP